MTAAAAAVVHASDRTRVTRLTLDERTVIRKEPLGTDAQRRLRHEVGMLERLRGAEGVAQLVDAPQYPDSIVMEDAGRTTLAELAKPLDVDDLIALAVQLARALAAMHGRGVMHRDIAPANIVVSAERCPLPGGLRARDGVRRDPPRVHAPQRDRGDAAVSRARSRPAGRGGRSISAPTSTRWARRSTSWRRVSRRSAPAILCD